jgi:glucose-6-phosphate-specific signal transduction histidine kinase
VQLIGGSLPLALAHLSAEQSAERSITVVCNTDIAGLRLEATQCDQLYRIAQECLRLSAGRPDCRKISIELRLTDDTLMLTSVADGKAPMQHRAEDKWGWGAVSYLARVIGGTAHIEESDTGGIRSRVWVPRANLVACVDATSAH